VMKVTYKYYSTFMITHSLTLTVVVHAKFVNTSNKHLLISYGQHSMYEFPFLLVAIAGYQFIAK
jgi:hypothetical protein